MNRRRLNPAVCPASRLGFFIRAPIFKDNRTLRSAPQPPRFAPLSRPASTRLKRNVHSRAYCSSRLARCSRFLAASALCQNESVTKYAVVIHEEPEGGFWAEVPALPGCYSQGDSIPELMNNVREAIAGVIEVLREQGRQPESNIQILDVAV
ncbi:MAG: type II toxin-antitoxin system HicB family antitoxin [Bryobacterales bacterium]|nr:type II toxin-antitoxin system HicB family antitoxin [Bryobacterales bacterium]